jgi:hypothetical protein
VRYLKTMPKENRNHLLKTWILLNASSDWTLRY